MSKRLMPKLKPYERHAILFMLKHLVYGAVGGFSFGIILLALDVGGLRSLIFNSSDRWIALFLLFFGLFITFGGVGMGVGVMNINNEEN